MFKEPKHIDWLALVEKELKKSPEPYLISEDLWANPFLGKTVIPTFSNQKTTERWIISQKAVSNSEILTSLDGGVNGISIDLRHVKSDFKDLLKEVKLEYITLRILVNKDEGKAVLNRLNIYILSEGFDFNNLDIVVSGLTIDNFISINALFNNQLTLEIGEDKSDADSLADLIDLGQKLRVKQPLKLAFKLKSVENFYLNIARIKALRHIWKKLEEHSGIKYGNARFFVSVVSEKEDPNIEAIALTQMVASSAIAGADCIEIEDISYPESMHSIAFSKRITRNIQHVLENESFLGQVDDASEGSYFLDDLTQKLILLVWQKFLAKNE